MLIIGATCRVQWSNKDEFDRLYGGKKGWILSFWHENVLIIPWLLRNRGITCMVSDSRDGEYIARTGLVFGNKVIRGSSSKGSAKATRAALRLLRNNQVIAITPDGPRGPAHQLQPGVLWLSALSSSQILPLHIEADRQWRFKSWDQQKIPKPFSTIYVNVLPPEALDKHQLTADENFWRRSMRSTMMQNANQARKDAGYAEIK